MIQAGFAHPKAIEFMTFVAKWRGAGALVRESSFGSSSATFQLLSDSNREGFWHSKIRHPIQDITGDDYLDLP